MFFKEISQNEAQIGVERHLSCRSRCRAAFCFYMVFPGDGFT